MIKISKYHVLPLFAIIIAVFMGDATNTTLVWAVLFFAIEFFVIIGLARSAYLNKKFFYLNFLLFVMHLIFGILITYANLAMNVGASSLIYRN